MADSFLRDYAKTAPAQFAASLEGATPAEVLVALEALSPELAGAVAARMPQVLLMALVREQREILGSWLEAARFDDVVRLLSRLPRETALLLADGLDDSGRRRRLKRILQYPEHCVGSVISSTALQMPLNTPIARLLQEMRDQGSETPVVLVNERGLFEGGLNLWKLLVRESDHGLAGEFLRPMSHLYPETSLSDAGDLGAWAEEVWLPVVDVVGRVLGVVSRQRVLASRDVDTDLVVDNVVQVGSELFRVSGDLLTNILVRER